MRKNGFTLIELLAVIVILAIIALIATPIILGIINDAREKSNERSVELYAAAVKNGIAAYQLKEGKEVSTGTYNKDNKLPFEIDIEGNVECNTIDIYKNGEIYVADCKVNGKEVEYTNGTKRYEPQYYIYEPGFHGIVGEVAAPENPSSEPPTGEIRYLGYDVIKGVITTAYVCFVRNDTEYCLKGTTDGSSYATNVNIIKEAFADLVDTDNCVFEKEGSGCAADIFGASADSDGSVSADDVQANCHVSSNFLQCNGS